MNPVVEWLNGWNVGGKTSIIWFVILASILVFIALKIVKNAEVLTAKTKFGGGVIGGVLIAAITAAPEFITSIQQSLLGQPGAASADNVGANAITGFMIGLAALLFIRETWMARLHKYVIITLWVSFAIALFMTIMMYLKVDAWIGKENSYAIGIIPLILLVFYFIMTFLEMKFGEDDEHSSDEDYVKNTSIKKASTWFLIWGVLLIGLSVLLNYAVESMEDGFNIPQESAGGIFLAIAMALPEGVAFIKLVQDRQYTTAVSVLVGHGFALFVSEWLADMAYADAPTYTTEAVHQVWPIGVITTSSFALLGTQALLTRKIKLFRENKLVYSILPTITVLTYIVGWVLILTLYY